MSPSFVLHDSPRPQRETERDSQESLFVTARPVVIRSLSALETNHMSYPRIQSCNDPAGQNSCSYNLTYMRVMLKRRRWSGSEIHGRGAPIPDSDTKTGRFSA